MKFSPLKGMKPIDLLNFLNLLAPLALIALLCMSAVAVADWAGEIALESTFYTESPQYSRQSDDANLSASFQPEYYTNWDNRDQSLEFIPFFRVDHQDEDRTHVDIRELAWTKVYDSWEIRAGISRVFWGVTEFQHLVDVINQTDSVENVDGEDKLGQPMVILTSIQDWGTLDFYALPYFRERTYPGIEGRLRTPLQVNTNLTQYESDRGQYHPDFALRYSNYFGDWDVGLAHFSGTNRDPILSPPVSIDPVSGEVNAPESFLVPYYELMEQTSLELQATKGSMLYKLEALQRQADSGNHNAAVAGIEYSFYGVSGSFADLGVLVEYHYDDRSENAPTIFEDDIAIGARLAFNDAQSTELLAGVLVDRSTGGNSISIEGSRRINNNFFVELESRLFHGQSSSDPAIAFTQDDFIRLNLIYNF